MPEHSARLRLSPFKPAVAGSDALVRTPRERPPGSSARRPMSLARRLQGGANGTEFLRAQCCLDASKQRPLLVTHVIAQTLAERTQGARVDRPTRLELADPTPNVHWLDEHPHDTSIVSPAVTGKGRQ